uniref:Uncharacterized protein n=1 Tax=Arundo donax TaxID=35708 RepID=A0A0A9BRV1_ARUDO
MKKIWTYEYRCLVSNSV